MLVKSSSDVKVNGMFLVMYVNWRDATDRARPHGTQQFPRHELFTDFIFSPAKGKTLMTGMEERENVCRRLDCTLNIPNNPYTIFSTCDFLPRKTCRSFISPAPDWSACKSCK